MAQNISIDLGVNTIQSQKIYYFLFCQILIVNMINKMVIVDFIIKITSF